MQNTTVPESKELAFALQIARQAGDLALEYYNQGITGSMKQDNTPVTIADQKCERLIRKALAESFPDDAILGEEEGGNNTLDSSRRKWIIDPIDGTYNFTRQLPVWSVLLALEEDGDIVLGILNAPANDEIFWAEKGSGTYRNGQRVHVSKIDKVADTQFEFGAPARLAAKGYWEGLRRISEATYRQRAYGDYLNFAHVLCGKAEAALEVGVKTWDIAAMKILATEAGGRYSDLIGGESVYTGSCLVSNGLVHDELLKLLRGD